MKNVFKFIGKFNVATLAIFSALYIVCLVLVLIAVNPKYNYDISPNYDHDHDLSEIYNSYQIIYRRQLVNNDIDESYFIRMGLNSRTSFEDKTDKNYSIVKYQAEMMQVDKSEYYFGEVNNVETAWSRTTYLGEEHEPTAFYGKVKYIDENSVTKTKTFKEEMFNAPKKLDDYETGNTINFDDVQFIYQVITTKDGEDYNVSMRMVSTTNKAFHIDLQSWILTEDGSLLPFAGAYGLNNGTWNATNEKVIKELKAKSIVCKIICYFDGKEFELHYKDDLDELKTLYSDVEKIDAKRIEIKEPAKINKTIAIVAISLTFGCAISIITICIIKSKRNKSLKNA